METGSRDEQMMLANIARIARALERIACALEGEQRGIQAKGFSVAATSRHPNERAIARDISRAAAADDPRGEADR